MNATVMRTIDVLGAAILLGLVVRWGPQFAQVVSSVGLATAQVIRQVTLADIDNKRLA